MQALNGDRVRAGEAALASLGISATAIVDLAPKVGAEFIGSIHGGAGSAGNRVHHVALALPAAEYEALKGRLDAAGVARSEPLTQSGGARGLSREAFYFSDPDGNVLEARVYECGWCR